MRRLGVLVLSVVACGGKSSDDEGASFGTNTTVSTTVNDDGGSTTATSGSTSSASTIASTSDASTGESGVDSGNGFVAEGTSTSGGPMDCTMTTDCASCWDCAKQGACKATYESCQAMFNCVPALVCVESMCAEGGLTQQCFQDHGCCTSCMNLMTCPMVDGVISCIEQQCATVCGTATC